MPINKFKVRAVNKSKNLIRTTRNSIIHKKKFRQFNLEYNNWLNKQKYVKTPSKGPKISILLPTYNTNISHLKECIESVINQTYKNWELCIVDDSSTNPEVYQTILAYKKADKRIKAKRLEKNGHICVATNEAYRLSTGEYVSLLDHDDIIHPPALAEVANTIINQKVDLIYTDEDKLSINGQRQDPFFKPDFSPYFLRSCNYITHFTTINSKLFKKIGGFRLGTEGAQDWDLILRATEKSRDIFHIPKVLYSWRMSADSTAMNAESKPYAYQNQRRVLRDHMKRIEMIGNVKNSKYSGIWNALPYITGNPKVSIIIPNKNSEMLIKQCLDSIYSKTSYNNFEVIVVDTGSDSELTKSIYSHFKKSYPDNFKVINVNGEFNFSKSCNYGVNSSSGEYVLLLNNDTKVIFQDWIENMLCLSQQDKVGAVGAKLVYKLHLLQHIGVSLNKKLIALHYGINKNELVEPSLITFAENIRETSAVTAACLMVSKSKYNEVGGFEEKLRVTYNDVDFCLKLLRKGYSNIYTPRSKLYHFESKSVGAISTSARNMNEFEDSKRYMLNNWSHYLDHEKYYRVPDFN